MTTLGSYKAGSVYGSANISPGKSYVPLQSGTISANLNLGGAGQVNLQSSEPLVVETETVTFGSAKPTAIETVSIGLAKPTSTITSTIGQPRLQTTIISGNNTANVGIDAGVKSVTAKLLEQYDRKNTGVLEVDGLRAFLQDVYKIVGEPFVPKPGDLEGLVNVLDVNNDGRVTSDDLEAKCQKILNLPNKTSGPADHAARKHGEREVKSGRPDEDEKPKPPEVEFASQIFDATKIFGKFDTDKSGFLEENEIPFVLQETYNNLGIKKEIDPKQVQSYIRALDQNKDGKISLDEFIKVLVDNLQREKNRYKPTGVSYSVGGYQRAVIKTELEKAREIFDRYDTDKSGFLELNEIPAILTEILSPLKKREITSHDVAAYMKCFDTNLDHKISFEEFTRLVDVANKAQ